MSIEQTSTGYDERIRNKLINALSSSKSFWSLAKTIRNTFTNSPFSPLTKDDGTMTVLSEDKSEVFVGQFARNSTQGKQPPTIPEVGSSMIEIVFKHRTIGHIVDGLNVNNSSGPYGIAPLVLNKCALKIYKNGL